MRSARLAGVVAALAPAAAVVAPAPALAVVPACGSTIHVNTTLTGNMTCPGNGINIGSANVVLDLNGFTITGPGPDVRPAPDQIYAGVRVNSSGAVVKNGRIQGFTIAVTTTVPGDNVEVTGLTLQNNGQGYLTQSGGPGGVAPFSDNTWFHHNTVFGSTGLAVSIQGNGHRVESNTILGNRFGVSIQGSGVTFRGNTVDGNQSTGVNVGGNVLGDNNLVAGNSITNNTGNGVNIGGPSTTKVLHGNRLEGNRIAQNGDPNNTFGAVNVFSSNGAVVAGNQVVGIGRAIGVALISGTANTLVSSNQLTANTDGIFVSAGTTGTRLVGNTAARNVDDGIHVESPATTLTANGAFQNAAFGIRAVNGVIDGGGNRASGNGVAQCSPSLACT
ncbi:MAG TPA: right-handed parallel beta-helix repeat-containing protein [Acidimicrobiales bacterium]|nr:right-handed parallel beta-helix repeat-containing protein [Acidimicrobiales bacterium]